MVDPDLAYTYVLAHVDLALKVVVISQADKLLKVYDYSPLTVGLWAADNQQKIVKDETCNAVYCTCEP